MKVSMKKLLLGTVMTTGIVAGGTMMAQAASDTSNATATIVAAIAITNTQDLAFASIVPSGSADTVIVSAAGARTCGGTLTCTGTVTASSFDVTGGANLTYAVTLPGAAANLTGPGTDMTVDTWTDSISSAGTLDGAGTQTFTVGGTLNVGANQTAGAYTGTFSVTVDYN